MDETYIKVKGEWRYLYRAVDKQGQTIDFLLTEHRDKEAALRFLTKAIRRHDRPPLSPPAGGPNTRPDCGDHGPARGW
jgi:transposase-like protein